MDPDEAKYDFDPALTQTAGENTDITVPDNLLMLKIHSYASVIKDALKRPNSF